MVSSQGGIENDIGEPALSKFIAAIGCVKNHMSLRSLFVEAVRGDKWSVLRKAAPVVVEVLGEDLIRFWKLEKEFERTTGKKRATTG